MQLPTQQQFVDDCLSKYWFSDLPTDQQWEEAHFPLPECLGGEKTVMLWSADHTVQGLLQSVELDHRCFHYKANKKDLYNLETHYPQYLPLFQQLKFKFNSRHGQKALEMGVGVHARSFEQMSAHSKKAGKIGGRRCVELGVGAHAPGMKSAAGKIGSASTNAQLWQCLKTQHISNSGGLSTWQKAREIDTSLRIRRLDLEQFQASQNIAPDVRPPF